MAAKKVKKVTVEIDVEVLKKLVEAADAISELASAFITYSDDRDLQALAKQRKAKTAKPAKKRARRRR